jgi:hypothetical protein
MSLVTEFGTEVTATANIQQKSRDLALIDPRKILFNESHRNDRSSMPSVIMLF